MKNQLFIALIATVICCACNRVQKKDETPVVGEDVDSAAIAVDTSTQKAMESSYEYSNTVTVNNKLVFDVMAYGGPATKGEYAIIKRGADNKPDTIAHGERNGIIASSFTADLNHNSLPEVYLVVQTADTLRTENIIVYEYNVEKNETVELDGIKDNHHAHDSIYVEDDKFLVLRYPIKNNTAKPEWMKLFYKLNKHEFQQAKP